MPLLVIRVQYIDSLVIRTQTRITTKYTVSPAKSPSSKRPSSSTTTIHPSSTSNSTGTAASHATLTLKAYDPVSGACLKYQTTQAAEVGRLMGALDSLSRPMCGLPVGSERPLGARDAEAAAGGGREPMEAVEAHGQGSRDDKIVAPADGNGSGKKKDAGASGTGGGGGKQGKRKKR